MNVLKMSDFQARPAVRKPLESIHTSITEEQISDLVEQFYARVLASERLGPIFSGQTSGPWSEHLSKMKSFWRSVLLRNGEYKGKPVPAHQRLEGVTTDDFEEWLGLFSLTCQQVFSHQAASLVEEAARRIATSLWLARANDPFATPPDWSGRPAPAQTPNASQNEGKRHETTG